MQDLSRTAIAGAARRLTLTSSTCAWTHCGVCHSNRPPDFERQIYLPAALEGEVGEAAIVDVMVCRRNIPLKAAAGAPSAVDPLHYRTHLLLHDDEAELP